MKEIHPHVGLGISAHTAVIEASLMRYACPLPEEFKVDSFTQLKETVQAIASEKASTILIVEDLSGTIDREAIREVIKQRKLAIISGVYGNIHTLGNELIQGPHDNSFYEVVQPSFITAPFDEPKVRAHWLGEDHNRTMVKRRVNQPSKKKKRRKR